MGVNYAEVIDRMKRSCKLKNDSAVARALSITPQALSNYKKRGEMPSDLALRFSNIFGLSVDWLISGVGQMHRPGAQTAETETQGFTLAAEQTSAYGKTEEGRDRTRELVALSPDEIIYVGKLLKIMRGQNKNTSEAIRYAIDAFTENVEVKAAANTE